MKSAMYLIFTLILFTGFGVSYAKDFSSKDLSLIDSKRESIDKFIERNEHFDTYRHDHRQIYNIATEGDAIYRLAGANLDRYYRGEDLLKATATFEGEDEDLVSDYYYLEGEVIFVLKTNSKYSSPKWSDEETDKKVSINKYYFVDGNLAAWFGSDNKKITKESSCDAFIKAETEIKKDANLYMKLLQEKYIESGSNEETQ